MLAAALLSGIDGYSDYLLSVHMVQHTLLLMVAPVLLLWAHRFGSPWRAAAAASAVASAGCCTRVSCGSQAAPRSA